MQDLAARIKRLRPTMNPTSDFQVEDHGLDGQLFFWNEAFPRPTEAELLAVDLTQPTAEELRVRAVKQILKDDVPDAWRTSTNAQQRVAWALKWGLIETRRDFADLV